MSNFKARPYQDEISTDVAKCLMIRSLAIINMEVRTGKTFTALLAAKKIKAKTVLFVTTKKAIPSIENDFKTLNPGYDLVCINYESVHKVQDVDKFDLIICDESHKLGAFPKPSVRTKKLKELFGFKKIIIMTGTLTPESFSQIYHQLWISNYSPFKEVNFYKWAKKYVNITKQRISGGKEVNNYSNYNIKLIENIISPYRYTYTQKQAGFKSVIHEKKLIAEMPSELITSLRELKKNKMLYLTELLPQLDQDNLKEDSVVLGDTAVKLKSKFHQLISGTIKLENGDYYVISDYKAKKIKEFFCGKKIAIFYKFKAELTALKNVFSEDELTTDISEFQSSKKNLAVQFVSGREGTKLSMADYLVMYNIDYSAVTYWQARDRMTTIDRPENTVYWVFSNTNFENKVLDQVSNKKDYTLHHFKADLKIN